LQIHGMNLQYDRIPRAPTSPMGPST
jgi:hypothetical protein